MGAEISKALGFEEEEAAADISLGCGQLSGQSCWAEFKVYACVFHHCFSFPNCPMSGPVLGPGNGPILGPHHMVFYCGVLFGGSKLRPDSFSTGVDWCAQQAQLQGHELLWLNVDETCVQRGMPTASGAVVGPTVLHISTFTCLFAWLGCYLGSLSLIPDCVAVCEISKKEETKTATPALKRRNSRPITTEL